MPCHADDNILLNWVWRSHSKKHHFTRLETGLMWSGQGEITHFWVATYYYSDVIMGTTASQITSLTIVSLTVYSCRDLSKYQSPASLAFVTGEFPAQMRSYEEIIPFDDVIMTWIGIKRKYAISITAAALAKHVWYPTTVKHCLHTSYTFLYKSDIFCLIIFIFARCQTYFAVILDRVYLQRTISTPWKHVWWYAGLIDQTRAESLHRYISFGICRAGWSVEQTEGWSVKLEKLPLLWHYMA